MEKTFTVTRKVSYLPQKKVQPFVIMQVILAISGLPLVGFGLMRPAVWLFTLVVDMLIISFVLKITGVEKMVPAELILNETGLRLLTKNIDEEDGLGTRDEFRDLSWDKISYIYIDRKSSELMLTGIAMRTTVYDVDEKSEHKPISAMHAFVSPEQRDEILQAIGEFAPDCEVKIS